MADDELRNAVHAIVARLQADVEAQVAQLEARHRDDRETIRRETEARTQAETADAVAREWAAKLEHAVAQAHEHAEARLRAELAEAAAAADHRIAAEKARLLAEAEQAASELSARLQHERQQAILDATARARDDREQAIAEATARLREEREHAIAEATARAHEERERAIGEATARAHEERDRAIAEMSARADEERERAIAQATARVRDELTQEIERRAQEHGRQVEERLREEARRAADSNAREREEQQRAIENERDRLMSELHGERQKIASLTASLEQTQSWLSAEKIARETAEALVSALESRHDSRAQEQAAGARVEERQAKIALVEQLLTAIRSVSEARSLSDTLNALAAAAGSLAPRVALFIVNERSASRELQGWRASGFGDPSPALLHLPADDGGLLATVASSRRPIPTSTLSAPDFASLGADRAGLAVPLTVGGKTVAVLYADDGAPGEPEAPSSWPEAIQILGAHASVCLSHITAVRTTQAMRSTLSGGSRPPEAASEEDHSARRYARLLVSEIKLYNEAAVRAGREKRDLLTRLGPEIDRARRLYEERIPPSIAARSRYFHEELVHTLADGDAALLGSRSTA